MKKNLLWGLPKGGTLKRQGKGPKATRYFALTRDEPGGPPTGSTRQLSREPRA